MIISYSLCSDILLDPRGVPGQSKFRHCSARVVTDWTCFDFQTAVRSVYEIRGLLRYRGRDQIHTWHFICVVGLSNVSTVIAEKSHEITILKVIFSVTKWQRFTYC